MIVTELDLIKFAKDVYEMSVPRGMGFWQPHRQDLTDEDAARCVTKRGLNMDYVNGRGCKMAVHKTEKGFRLPNAWCDHTDDEYIELLKRHGIEHTCAEHGTACECKDCLK